MKVFDRIRDYAVNMRRHAIVDEPFTLSLAEAWELAAYVVDARLMVKSVRADEVIDVKSA